MPRTPKTKRPAARPAARPPHPVALEERNGPRREVLMLEVLNKAEALFASRGFAATSLQDIATEIGLSRTSMYYYFSSKEALLGELVRGVAERTAVIFAELGSSAEITHSARLAAAAERLVLWVTDPQTLFKLLDRNESELPKKMAASHRETRRRVLAGMTEIIEDGIAAGEFRALDARVAAFAILGMCNWTAWWHSPSRGPDRKAVAEQIASLALAAVRRSELAGDGQDVRTLAAAIRDNLDLIERMAQPAGRSA